MTLDLIEYADREMLAIELANRLAGELKNCLLVHEFASLAVPGGSTPGEIFDNLSGARLDWDKVHVLLTDERWVAPDHEQSNARLVRNRLLTDHAAAARFIPFYTDGQTAAEAAPILSERLAGEFPISVLVLGMGADMHTASLFPGADGLAEALAPDAPSVCAINVPGHDIGRITLSRGILEGAMSKHLVIFGDEKREAVERAISLPPEEAPIGAVLGDAKVHWAA
jgi:6-phosphogluconolactonase